MSRGKKQERKLYAPLSAETYHHTGHQHYTRLYDDFLQSKPWKQLSHAARSVYLVIKMNYKGHYTGNDLTCTYRQFKEYGMNSTTVKRALRELEESGFIDIELQQMVNRNLHRAPTIYRLSDRWHTNEELREGRKPGKPRERDKGKFISNTQK